MKCNHMWAEITLVHSRENTILEHPPQTWQVGWQSATLFLPVINRGYNEAN